MTRAQLIDTLAAQQRLTRRTTEEAVDLVFDAMRDALLDGGRVEIRGFGSLKVQRYGAYQGRNPRTGEPVAVPPKVLPVFKASRGLLARLNKEHEA